MEYRPLGRTGLMVSAICLGTGFRGQPDNRVARATIDAAIDGGVNFLDCANMYRGGESERVLGEALKGRRDRLILTTKCGSPVSNLPNDRGLSRRHIVQQIETSLRRLQTDYVDLYFAHQPDPRTPLEVSLRAFDDLVRQGKVRYVACSNFQPWEIAKMLWIADRERLAPPVAIQHNYNLLDRMVEREHFPLVRSEGLGLMTYSALAIGLLTGRFRHGQPPPADSVWGNGRPGFDTVMTAEAQSLVDELARIGRERGKSPGQVAIAWILFHPEVSAAMIGPDTPEQLAENLGGQGWSLSPEESASLDAASAFAPGGTPPRGI